MELWIALAGILGMLVTAWATHRFAMRQSTQEWDRQMGIRREEWKREEKRRWDEKRAEVYSELVRIMVKHHHAIAAADAPGSFRPEDWDKLQDSITGVEKAGYDALLWSQNPKVIEAIHGVMSAAERSSQSLLADASTDVEAIVKEYQESLDAFINAASQEIGSDLRS
jgi:hypothetical protein